MGEHDIDGLIDAHWSSGLTPAVAERWRYVREAPMREDEAFVLCWLHHAIRDHDNPALDAAVAIGNAIGRPVLVYQGLGGRHRYNSDRHHVFIMQGARDLQAGLADRGIAYAFWLPTDPSSPSPLRRLADRACAVVTEDFPAPPMPRWTDALAARTDAPVIAVDAACVAPLRLLGEERHTRAFAFRKAAQRQWKPRYRPQWVDVQPAVDPLALTPETIGFDPTDLRDADLIGLAAACDIDHSIPPVARLFGGTHAGYQRWHDFLERHLDRYDDRRNDATDMDAVSGLSPYLHHGHVSPFRIARDADEHGGSGAHKFLDELLTWRELAHHYCARTPEAELESITGLPAWAHQTLADHADDEREAVYSWETLSRAATGDALWDAAQRSLLRNGELHNNVRMTWGKMLPRWTATPEEALRALIGLNHRYALDGSDPSSYGGLLWCLGQFDRPFPPGQPVLGTLRDRTTTIHAKRLRPSRYAAAVESRSGYEPLRVAVVGAGIAGLACARTLVDQGCNVVVLDRGRRPGGRASARRIEVDGVGSTIVDHGAVGTIVTDPRFGRYVRSWIADGVAQRWPHERVAWRAGQLSAIDAGGAWVVGRPTMAAIAGHLAEGIDVRPGSAVAQIDRHGDRWTLAIEQREASPTQDGFDAIVLATAPPQALRLLGGSEDALTRAVASIAMLPAWVGVFVVEDNGQHLPEWVETPDHPSIDRIVRADRKPGRDVLDGYAAWIVHASAEWSEARYDADRAAVADELTSEVRPVLGDLIGGEPVVRFSAAHRWGMARPASVIEPRCLADPRRRLAVCGDGYANLGVEAAFLSGQAAAGRVLNWRPQRQTPPSPAHADSLFDAVSNPTART
ncbi:MAG: FAD-dependent oxidoreductase [Planctomycetota bacterium]